MGEEPRLAVLGTSEADARLRMLRETVAGLPTLDDHGPGDEPGRDVDLVFRLDATGAADLTGSFCRPSIGERGAEPLLERDPGAPRPADLAIDQSVPSGSG